MSLTHPFEPVFDKNSSILILGTFPSVKSREYGFYYGHPQNRFWKVIASITHTSLVPETIEEKKLLLLNNKIALWDILKRCSIKGSSDYSIKNTVPVDLSILLEYTHITQIFVNGEKAHQLFMRYFYKNLKKEAIKLPSTSSANAHYTFDKLVLAWKRVTQEL
ncbi:MAG: DNA-deoxyinosine glycosylase [Holosporales bacterium]|jgi:hypoxanthine-DNA glycosylase|nr:DNA-deoxyinosine glycosylase [Holosporales bacterium]